MSQSSHLSLGPVGWYFHLMSSIKSHHFKQGRAFKKTEGVVPQLPFCNFKNQHASNKLITNLLKKNNETTLPFYKLLVLNFSFAHKAHAAFRPLFYALTRSSWISFSVEAFCSRISGLTQMLLHLAYFDLRTLTFSNVLFWNETLTLNWLNLRCSSRDFQFLRHRFFFHDQKWTSLTPQLFTNFSSSSVETILVTDILTHQTNMRFLRRARYFLIGLIPINFNPWVVDFPVPIFTQNILIVYYILRLSYFSFAQASATRFVFRKHSWHTNLPLS